MRAQGSMMNADKIIYGSELRIRLQGASIALRKGRRELGASDLESVRSVVCPTRSEPSRGKGALRDVELTPELAAKWNRGGGIPLHTTDKAHHQVTDDMMPCAEPVRCRTCEKCLPWVRSKEWVVPSGRWIAPKG